MTANHGYVLGQGRKLVCRDGVDLIISGEGASPISLVAKWFVLRLYLEEHGNPPEFFLEDHQGMPL